jgi:hypothetical protein
MSQPLFLSNENMTLLWEVLIENKVFLNKPKEFHVKINNVFNENIQGFYQQEIKYPTTNSLINLNKKFITLLVQHIQNTVLPNYQKQNLGNDPIPILKEDIQNIRISNFEKNLIKAKEDFSNAMSSPVPTTPDFKDKTELPLSDLEIEIKKTIAQRNYDLEKYPPNRNRFDESWLKAQETSIKKEKLSRLTKDDSIPIRYISIDNTNLDNNILKKDIIELPNEDILLSKKEKHISWAKESYNESKEEKEELNILKFLKVIPEKSKSESIDFDLNKTDLIEKVKGMESRLIKIESLIEKLLVKSEKVG